MFIVTILGNRKRVHDLVFMHILISLAFYNLGYPLS